LYFSKNAGPLEDRLIFFQIFWKNM